MQKEKETVAVKLTKGEDWGDRILHLVAVGHDPKIVGGKIVYEREKVTLPEAGDIGPT